MNIDYYVYAYIDSQTKEIYYIGKGRNKRAYAKHRVIVPTDKNYIVFMEKNMTNTGACALERRYIRWYGRLDKNTGILQNKTDGGDGVDSEIAAQWAAKAKASGNFYIGVEATKLKRTTASRVLDGKKAHETRIQNNNPYTTEDSIAKMVTTRKAKDNYHTSEESIKKMINTRKERGLDEIVSTRMKAICGRDIVTATKELRGSIDAYIKNSIILPKIPHNCSIARKQELIAKGAKQLGSFFGIDVVIDDYKALLSYRDCLVKITQLPKNWHTFKDDLVQQQYYKLCRVCYYIYTVNSTDIMPASLIAAAQIGQGAAMPTLSDFVTLAI